MNKKLSKLQIQFAAKAVAILMSLTLLMGLSLGQSGETRIDFLPGGPYERQMEDLRLNQRKGHNYVVKIKKGQTLSITLHEKTKKMTAYFDAKNYNWTTKEFRMKAIETRDYYFGVYNPTTKALTYGLDIYLE